MDEGNPLELLEVQLCNSVAPFILISRRPAVDPASCAARSPARVDARERLRDGKGQFSRPTKAPVLPHTNIAKAALNMLTGTSAGEMFETDKILMTAVTRGGLPTSGHTRRSCAAPPQAGTRRSTWSLDPAAAPDHRAWWRRRGRLRGCRGRDHQPVAWVAHQVAAAFLTSALTFPPEIVALPAAVLCTLSSSCSSPSARCNRTASRSTCRRHKACPRSDRPRP